MNRANRLAASTQSWRTPVHHWPACKFFHDFGSPLDGGLFSNYLWIMTFAGQIGASGRNLRVGGRSIVSLHSPLRVEIEWVGSLPAEAKF